MSIKKYKPEQIVVVLRQIEVQGMPGDPSIVGDPEQEITQRVHFKQMVSHQHKEAGFIARCCLGPHQGDSIARPPVGSWQTADIEAVAIQLPHRPVNRIALAAHHQEDIQDAHFFQGTQVARACRQYCRIVRPHPQASQRGDR